jgi:serine/threonine protein kinase
VKILDFGLARQVPAGKDATTLPTPDRFTEPGTVMGTVGYMSPEQVRGEPGDARSDIFSFGAVLYELVSGRRAFQRPTAAETMTAILKDDPPPFSLRIGDGTLAVSTLARVIQHCLEKNPVERFQHASDIAFALEALCETPPAFEPAPRGASALGRAWPWRPSASGSTTPSVPTRLSTRRVLFAGSLVVLVIVAGTASWIWWSSSTNADVPPTRPTAADASNAAEGADAFARGQLYDALDRIEQAITAYERAFRLLPDDDPNKEIAKTRLDALRAERSKLTNVLGIR